MRLVIFTVPPFCGSLLDCCSSSAPWLVCFSQFCGCYDSSEEIHGPVSIDYCVVSLLHALANMPRFPRLVRCGGLCAFGDWVFSCANANICPLPKTALHANVRFLIRFAKTIRKVGRRLVFLGPRSGRAGPSSFGCWRPRLQAAEAQPVRELD